LIVAAYLLNQARKPISKADYTDIQMFEEGAKGWFCGTGRKPLSRDGE
jgi:hypothetical protein